MGHSSFLGPTAPWMLEGEDEYVIGMLLGAAAASLTKRLETRLQLLKKDPMPVDVILTEIRRQIAESAVEGQIGTTSELADLAWEIQVAWESSRRV